MKNKIYQFFLALALVALSAFTFVPMPSTQPEIQRFIPEAVYEMPPLATFTLIASDIAAPKGSEVCVAVKAKDFNNIISMQYSMHWDAKHLKFKEVRSFNLPGLTTNNFGQHLSPAGVLTFSWYNPSLLGLQRPDETQLYEVCFQVTGESGSQSRIAFDGQPTTVEIATAAGLFLQLKSQDGAVVVKP